MSKRDDELRKMLEALCYSAGAYEDSDGDGWPVQSSLEDGFLKKDVNSIIKYFRKQLKADRTALLDQLVKCIEEMKRTTLRGKNQYKNVANYQHNQALSEVTALLKKRGEK